MKYDRSKYSSSGRALGLSLIELLVALAIAALLLLGLSQIFIGSKNAYRLQDGMSRTQENARFVLQYLEDNVRMAGYMGCANDVNVAGDSKKFINHLGTRTSAQGAPLAETFDSISKNFARPIEGFAYTTPTDTNGQQPTAASGPAAFTPRWLATDTNPQIDSPVKGSDILVLRIISPESIAMAGNLDIVNGTFSVASSGFVTAGQPYALTSCANTQIFNATTVAGTTVTALASNPLRMLDDNSTNTWTGTYANQYFAQGASVLSGEVHRAEYLPIYVSLRGTTPVLKVGSNELVDNVEAMRVWYGIDNNSDGTADAYVTADQVAPAGATQQATDDAWRKVLSVRIALLMRSEDRASASARNDPGTSNGANNFRLFTDTLQRPIDGRFRDVYTTTIALRNRLVNY